MQRKPECEPDAAMVWALAKKLDNLYDFYNATVSWYNKLCKMTKQSKRKGGGSADPNDGEPPQISKRHWNTE